MTTRNAIRINLDKRTEAFIRNLVRNREQLPSLIRTRLQRLASRTAGFVIKTSLSGQRLNRRTGALARSTTGQLVNQAGLPAIQVGVFRGPALVYAGIQEEGGVIEPKNAKALAIPQEPALTAAGVDRFGGPRNAPFDLRFLPFRGSGVAVGKLVSAAAAESFEAAGQSPYEAQAIYLLVERVTIPASKWLSAAVIEYLPTIATEVANIFAELAVGQDPSE